MQFSIQPTIFELYPELCVVAVVARDIGNQKHDASVTKLLRGEEENTRQLFQVIPVSEHPNIASWRKAYSAFGVGGEYRSSIENLIKRVAKGGDLPDINTLVDLYNAVSLKYILPIGGEDLAHVKGGLSLRIAEGSEEFVALGSSENDPPKAGEVVYADEAGCICRRFNWREADRTKLTKKTKHAIFMIEGIPPANEFDLKDAATMLASWLQEYCGASTEQFLLHKQQTSITFTV